MPTPSIGRIVHYQSYGTPNGEYVPEVRAAIITAVQTEEFGEGYVALAILNPTGLFFKNDGVKYAEEYKPGCWSWPPRVE